jgi:DNA repair photolyase
LKKDVIKCLSRDIKKNKDRFLSISNSSDPYPPEEKKYRIMKKILPFLKESGIRVLLVTKSNLVTRDVNILRTMPATVSLSITTLDTQWAKKIEPHAPVSRERIQALKLLSSHGITCSVRLDPIIPGINDEEIDDIIQEISPYCQHVVSSTVKPRKDGIRRLSAALPDIIKNLSFQAQGNTYYLPAFQRYTLMKKVKESCEAEHLTFATCREGFSELHTATCDGSHLI